MYAFDPDILEFHARLMKLAGIDGVIIDWFGTGDYFDYARTYQNASAIADQGARIGLTFAVCYEYRTVPRLVAGGRIRAEERVEQAHRDIAWLRASWFRKPGYLKLGGRPVLFSFRRDGLTDAEWTQVLGREGPPRCYLSEHERRPGASGAFDWSIPGRRRSPGRVPQFLRAWTLTQRRDTIVARKLIGASAPVRARAPAQRESASSVVPAVPTLWSCCR
jgi:hypothetical protein